MFETRCCQILLALSSCYSFAWAISSISTSSLTLLFQNSLNWTENSLSHVGFLLAAEPVTFSSAESVCANLSERVVQISSLTSGSSGDLANQLQYQKLINNFAPDQKFWVTEGNTPTSKTNLCAALQLQGADLGTSEQSCSMKLPVLCTQSAPYSNAATRDTSSTWQIVVHGQGKTFTGYRDYASFRFFGIPYANPPARFTYSTIFSGDQTTFDATTPGAHCVQSGDANVSEDCLFLNIFTPTLPGSNASPAQLKKVMFWIHGGGFTGGTGSDSTFDGGALASRGDVVLVTINYRLSTLGFLALNDGVVNGNYGLADQIAALEWVKQNIATFGGDPTQITIFGQSAGGASVRALLASPKADGLFQGAIAESNLAGADYATSYSEYYTQPEELAAAADAIISAVNCTNSDPAVVRECLLAVPAVTLVNLPAVARFVVVDGTYITSTGLALDGKTVGVSKVPIIWGWMAFDGAALIGYPQSGQTFEQSLISLGVVNQTMASTVVASGLFQVPDSANATLDVFNATARVATNVEFRCLDQATVAAAVQNDVFTKVYAYQFDRSYQTPGFSPNFPTCEAPVTAAFPAGDPNLPYLQCHSGELYYVFGNLGQFALPYRDDEDLFFSQEILDAWTAFARTHDPNPAPAFLEARGYTTAMQQGTKWAQVEKGNLNGSTVLRRLNGASGGSSTFLEMEECALLGFPLDFYL